MPSPSTPPSSARQRCALWGGVVLGSLLTACASSVTKAPDAPVPTPKPLVVKVRPAAPVTSPPVAVRAGPAPTREIDGPGSTPPPDPASVPDAEPTLEAIRLGGPNKPYEALGRSYVPLTEDKAYTERGLASWYGRKFHGRRTASGERYDMYAMTAAHPTLPLPSFVRVRNPAKGTEVVVRVNDRGPFHPGRIIDLSYTAALKLDILHGVATVEVERITQEEIRTGSWRRDRPATDPADVNVDRQLAQRRAVAPTVLASVAMPVLVPAPLPSTAAVSAATLSPGLAAPMPAMAPPVSAPLASPQPPAAQGDSLVAKGLVATPADAVATIVPVGFVAVSAPPAASPSAGALAAVATPSTPRPAAAAGFWVQIGAFRLRDGAENFQRRVVADLGWIAPVLSVLSEAEWHRLQAGPYANRDEANGIAQRVRDALSLVPVVVERH